MERIQRPSTSDSRATTGNGNDDNDGWQSTADDRQWQPTTSMSNP
ncbi:hypothetical protein [Streptomyces actinomycinicus]|nr:hypothetical protein [Streptomyces actinomycinicus]